MSGKAEPKPEELTPFHVSMADHYGALDQYHDITWLSFRDVFWRLGRLHAEGYTAREFPTWRVAPVHCLSLRSRARLVSCCRLTTDSVFESNYEVPYQLCC